MKIKLFALSVQRAPVKRAIRVNRTDDKPPGLVRDRHSAEDLD